jgi:hypothetical protein
MNRLLALTAIAPAILACARGAHADPTKHDCVAANDGGQDARQAGKLADARERFALCMAPSCPQPVREDCARRLEEVSRATPSVVFDAKDAAGSDLAAVRATADGRLLAERLDGAAVDVDPGEHRFVFEVAGQAPIERVLVVHEGEKARRISIVFGAAVARPSATSRVSTEPAVEPPGINTRRAIALAVAGAGVAGLALGIGSGVASNSKHSALDAECSPSGACPSSAQNDLSGFRSLRTVSTVGYIVGGVGLAGGVLLWFTAPSQPDGKRAAVWFGPGSVGCGGQF